ncbi:hypothetical protein ACHAWF_001028 [Thalassiosira exigua]
MSLHAASTFGLRCRVCAACPLPRSSSQPPLSQGLGKIQGRIVGAILPPKRTYASSHKSEQDKERKWTLLYHRNPSKSTAPRTMLGVSTFNFSYWVWYVLDFTPSVNASAQAKAALGQIDPETLEMLLINPSVGYVGLGVASAIWLGAYLYTKQLVSAIWAPKNPPKRGESRLAVSTLKLPLVTQPKILGRTVYNPDSNNFVHVELVEFAESELKSESSVEIFEPGEIKFAEEKRINDVIVKFDGEFSRLKGHIALKKEDGSDETVPLRTLLQQKYLLDINSPEEVMPNASPTLLRTLVLNEHHMKETRRDAPYKSEKMGDRGLKNGIDSGESRASVRRNKGVRKRKK